MNERLGLDEQGAVPSRVISQSPTVWYSTVMIDKGSNDGVEEGDPVVDGGGLVGRVRRVGARESQVVLITDAEFNVSVRVSGARTSGIVRTAVGDPDDLRLDYLGRNQQVREQQTIVTAGRISERFQPRFPADIPIGRVDRVDEDTGTVHVRPFAELKDLDIVQVLTEPAL
jgi:rod shape-determining protein MreC